MSGKSKRSRKKAHAKKTVQKKSTASSSYHKKQSSLQKENLSQKSTLGSSYNTKRDSLQRENLSQKSALDSSYHTKRGSLQKKIVSKKMRAKSILRLQIAQGTLQLFLTISFYLAVIATVSKLGNNAYLFAYSIFGNAGQNSTENTSIEFVIDENEDLLSISKELERLEIVDNAYSFYIRGKLSTSDQKVIYPGTYAFCKSTDYGEIIDIITHTNTVSE